MSAVIYQIGGGDKALILDTRQQFIYPFSAPNWLDIRIGYYVSICQSANNALITGLAETVTTVGNPADRYYIGIKQNNTILPNTVGSTFAGWTNCGTPEGAASSTIISSDIGTGTSNTNYWRAFNSGTSATMRLINGATNTGNASAGYIHFPQIAANAGGNATLIAMRMTRATSVATTVVLYYDPNVNGGQDVLWDSTCQIATIRSAFRTQTWPGSFTGNIVTVPDALFFYWPYTNSKLRIHAVCLEKFA